MVWNDQVRVDEELGAEAIARRTRAEWIVEGEETRLDLFNRETGHRAGEAGGEDDPFIFGFAVFQVCHFRNGETVSKPKRNLK